MIDSVRKIKENHKETYRLWHRDQKVILGEGIGMKP